MQKRKAKLFLRLNKRAFTLTEVLMAAGILALAISSILLTYTSCFVLIRTSRNVNIATNAALGLIEEIRTSTPFDEIATDYNGLTFVVNNIPNSMGVVYVDDTTPEFVRVTVSICWRQGNRVIGEDANLNGILDAGEDANGNGIIDSSVQLITILSNR